jgi:CBS domain-containing membrane protein
MKRDEPIETVMSTNVITVNVNEEQSEVRRLMSDEELHHVPVVSGKQLVGMLSVTDLVQPRVSTDHEPTIAKLMKTDLVTLRRSDTVRDAARHLRAGQFHALPVVDEQGDLVGIVTSTDLIRYFYDHY